MQDLDFFISNINKQRYTITDLYSKYCRHMAINKIDLINQKEFDVLLRKSNRIKYITNCSSCANKIIEVK